MILNRSWAVVVDDGHVSVLGNHGAETEGSPPLRTLNRHSIALENAGEYLEEALANKRFSALMLIGAPDDVSNFRKTLNEPVRSRVVAEVIRPNHKPEFLDERIEEMCA